MRVDRSGIREFGNTSSTSGKETSIAKKNGKVCLTAGEQDQVLITQVEDSLRIQVNSSSVLALSPEESKTLEILPGAGKVSIDSNVTIPIKGQPSKTEDSFPSRTDLSAGSGSKEETSITGSITQKLLASGLPDTSVLETRPIDLKNERLQPGEIDTPRPRVKDATLSRDVDLQADESPVSHLGTPAPVPDISFLETRPIELGNQDLQPGELPGPDQGEPASFIRSFIGSPSVSLSDQQTIQTLLSSVETPEEFNQIVNEAGGKKIGELFKNEEMKLSWDWLVGAYGRLDLADNRQEAKKTRELLLGDATSLQQYLIHSDQPLVLRGIELPNEIYLSQLDRRTTVCLVLENAVRNQESRPLINSDLLREKTLDILVHPDIPKEERMVLLEELKTTAGLSEYQMREIVSRPLAGFFEDALADLMTLRDSKTEMFQKQIQEVTDRFGPESVAVEIGRAERDEFLQSIDPEITQFQELKATASEIFSGPADPLVKIDSLFDRLLKVFVPPGQILPLLERIGKGSIVFEEGKLQSALSKVKVPELKNFVQQGIHLLQALPNVGSIVEQMRIADIHGFESFEFLQRLGVGTFRRQIHGFSQSMQSYQTASPFREIEEKISEWRTGYEKTTNRKERELMFETGRKLIQEFAKGFLEKPVNEVARSASDLRLAARCDEVIESVRTGGDLLLAFRNGHFVQILGAMNQRAGNSQSVMQIIQQALHLTTIGTNFFRGLLNRDWDKPIAQALKKDPRNKELREVHGMFSDALNLFLPLQSIDYLTPFLQYQKQLGYVKDETLRNELIQRFEAEASRLL